MDFSKEQILQLNAKGAKRYLSIDELKEIYLLFDRPTAKGALINGKCFISFNSLNQIQFIIENTKSFDTFAFIETLEKINLDKQRQNFVKFFLFEFWQGSSLGRKIVHLIYTVGIVLAFDALIIFYSTEKNISIFFTGLLSAVSIFIAVFSVFTANHDQMNRKKEYLFKSGKISYYFSVDKNLTIAGFIAIIACLAGIIITKDESNNFITNISFNKEYLLHFFSRKGLIVILINTSFTMTFLTLRSLIEFYIHRPEKYIIGELKDDYLKKE